MDDNVLTVVLVDDHQLFSRGLELLLNTDPERPGAGPGPHRARRQGARARPSSPAVYMPDLVRASAAAAGLTPDRLVTHIDPSVALLRTDGEKTLRILANLLQNAAKHSPADEPVEVRIGRSDGLVELAVLDRGPGIPPEIASQAFEKAVGFEPHRSSGLGMWIVAQFVESLQGSVWVEPRPGGGMAVRARFPLGVALSLPANRPTV